MKFRASHLLLVANLKGNKSMLVTATPLARVTIASLINTNSVTFTYIHTHS